MVVHEQSVGMYVYLNYVNFKAICFIKTQLITTRYNIRILLKYVNGLMLHNGFDRHILSLI
jgi:hypothetical protein